MPDAYLLGVDIGTYSSKGVIVNDKGEVIGSETLPHGIDMPAPGFFEHDAEKVWWKEFVQIVKSLLGNSGVKPENIHGIGTSAIGSCVLPIDGDGKPLRPAILYGIDTRSVKEIQYLEKIIGRDEITKRCGAPLSSQASGPKILWIRNNEPEVFKKTKWFLTSQAYLVFKLTGKPSIDIYTAAGYAPLFDIYNFSWYEDIAQHITSVEKL
ncbi:MAG: carbohydrate kinase, partial [Spirochaetes bacterium]